MYACFSTDRPSAPGHVWVMRPWGHEPWVMMIQPSLSTGMRLSPWWGHSLSTEICVCHHEFTACLHFHCICWRADSEVVLLPYLCACQSMQNPINFSRWMDRSEMSNAYNGLRDRLLMEYVCNYDNDLDLESWIAFTKILKGEELDLSAKLEWTCNLFPTILEVIKFVWFNTFSPLFVRSPATHLSA